MATKVWNQAAWKQNTYRSSTPKMHGPVGPANPLAVVHVACKGCGYHFCSCSHAPDGWRVAETSAQEMGFGLGVTVSGLAELANQPQTFRQLCDIDPSDEEVAEMNRPALLTLSEATEACRAGKVVRCVEDPRSDMIGWLFVYQFSMQRFACQTPENPNEWVPSRFPGYTGFDRPAAMRFEVVE
jgi:hypothetical protein